MNKTTFIETLKIINGRFINLPIHIARMEQTTLEVFGKFGSFSLSDEQIPADKKNGIIKCRIEYQQKIGRIDFIPYQPRLINTLKVVEDSGIDYHLKYADRTPLTNLSAQRGIYDEILITRQGKITDTSFSNIVLYNGTEYLTPSTYLLNGTKRQTLIQKGIIKPATIKIEDLKSFRQLHLINAMLDLDDVQIDISNIIL